MLELAAPGKTVRKSSRYLHGGLWVLLAAWFVVVLALGSNGFFVASQGTPPLRLLIASVAPVALFLFSILLSPSIKKLVSSADLKVATAVQAWRLGGYSFLILYGYGYLPGYFAWPAAVGDMFIGVTAPLMLARMNDPTFVQGRAFAVWNLLGILDLVVAVSMGALGSLLVGNPNGLLPTTIMSQLPLVLVPTFFVPFFVMLHLIALLQAKNR